MNFIYYSNPLLFWLLLQWPSVSGRYVWWKTVFATPWNQFSIFVSVLSRARFYSLKLEWQTICNINNVVTSIIEIYFLEIFFHYISIPITIAHRITQHQNDCIYTMHDWPTILNQYQILIISSQFLDTGFWILL